MRKKHLSGSVVGIFILSLSVGSVMPQGDVALEFDFPTIVAGSGNKTDVYATVFCDQTTTVTGDTIAPTIKATFFDQNGGIIEEKEEELICNGTKVLPFLGGDMIVFGHNRVQFEGPIQGGLVIEIVALNLEGAAPLGVDLPEPCEKASFTVIRNEELNAAVAVSNIGADPLECSFSTRSASGELIGQGTFEVPAVGQNQFFVSEKTVLPDVFTGWAEITCDGPFQIISFFQTKLGGLTTNPVDCADTDE